MPEPYYDEGGITIYHGDALDVLASLAPASVDAVVTDPPYIIGAVSVGSMASKSGGWADMMNSGLWFAAWYRLVGVALRDDGSFWSFCNWRTLPVVMRGAMDARMPITSVLVWDKEWIGAGGKQGLRPSHEFVTLCAKPGFAIPNRSLPDVWRHKTGSYKPHGHPAEKPEGLVARILTASALKPGALIVDPFAGSGTTLAAAQALGLDAIGIEAEERYCEMAARRCQQQRQQAA